MKVIEGIANIYKEDGSKHLFDYSIFVYPNAMIANAQVKKQGIREKMMQVGGRPVMVRIEIPEITEEVESYANGSRLTEEKG
jgi:hypothetical protein